MIDELGPDAPMTTNALGGKQSYVPFAMHLVPPLAVLNVAKTLAEGAQKYGVDNWRLINSHEQLNHALCHIYAWLSGDTGDDHLSHAACRVLFALELECGKH